MKTHNFKQHLADFGPIYLTQALFNGCFYGVRAIFVLYTINRFALSEAQAISMFATFMILCYGTSLLGGYIADKGLGVKDTIMVGGIFSALGLLCILFPSENLYFLGLALASLGSGYFKPNISTAVGLMFRDPKDFRKDRIYSIFYMAANFGSFIAMIICGAIGEIYGWRYGVILLVSIFIGGTCFVYKAIHFHPAYKENATLSKIKLFGINVFLVILIYFLFKYQSYFHSLMSIIICCSLVCLGTIFYHCNPQERKDVLTVILYILLFALSCTLFEQAGTSLTLFYEKAVDRQVVGITIPSSTFLALDPLFVLIYGPILLFLTAKYFEKKNTLKGFVKMGWGFLCLAFSFGILSASATYHNGASLISPLWIVGAMLIQTIGELWIAPVSFAKISQYAPLRFKSILMSFWSMAIAYGHYVAGFVAQFSLDATSLSFDNSFEGYHAFFLHIGIFPLCVGLSLLLYQTIQGKMGRVNEIRSFFLNLKK